MKTFIVILGLLLASQLHQQAQVIRTNLSRGGSAATIKVPSTAIRRVQISRTNQGTGASRIDPSKLRVFTRDAQEWKTVEEPVTSGADAISVPTVTGRSTIAVEPQRNRQALSSKPITVPFFMPPASAASSELIPLRIELHADPAPARWNAALNQFETDILIGVFQAGSRRPAPLRSAVQMDFRGEEAVIDPKMLVMTNAAEFRRVRATFPRNDVEARMDVLPFTEDTPLVLPVRRIKKIKTSISPKVIMGFGLGTANLTVSRLDDGNRLLNEGQEIEIPVESTLARLGELVRIPAGKSTVVHSIRSNGLGEDELVLDYAGAIERHKLKYVAPLSFFLFALAGGFFGGVVRWLLGKYNKKSKQPEGWRCLLEGIIAGVLITAAASAVVVTTVLPASVLETELAALLLSVAGGLSGVQGVKSVFGRIASFRQSADEVAARTGRKPAES